MPTELILLILGHVSIVIGGAWMVQIAVTAAVLFLHRWGMASIWPAIFCGSAVSLAWITACALSYGANI